MADQPNTVFTNEVSQPITQEAVIPAQEVKAELAPVSSDPYADLLKEIVREDGTQKYENHKPNTDWDVELTKCKL